MQRLVNTFTVILLITAGVVAASANDKIKTKYRPTLQDMEVLSEKLIELESKELSTIDDLRDYMKQVEDFALDYYRGDMFSMGRNAVAFKALGEVEKYADDVKASGSTRDMMDCGFLHTSIHHYNTILNIEQLGIKFKQNRVVTDETEAWLKLENTLNKYYAYSSYIFNQGGSMANLVASGSAWSLAEARYQDTYQLLKARFSGFAIGARNATSEDIIRKEANNVVASLTASANDLLDCDDSFKESPFYKEVSKGLSEACENLKTDMDAWISARLSMVICLEEQEIGTGETLKLLDNIKKIGEQEQ
ncbi:MAG: hypothetical protein J6X22_09185 [Muribaculaceae bacterium]|nr:hypothetical protein [Muribaculaceae bacterium]